MRQGKEKRIRIFIKKDCYAKQRNLEDGDSVADKHSHRIRYDLQFCSVEQMLVAHLRDLEIPACCDFPVGSDSCLPLIEGAPCSLDVTTEKAVLTFNVSGDRQPYEIKETTPQLYK